MSLKKKEDKGDKDEGEKRIKEKKKKGWSLREKNTS